MSRRQQSSNSVPLQEEAQSPGENRKGGLRTKAVMGRPQPSLPEPPAPCQPTEWSALRSALRTAPSAPRGVGVIREIPRPLTWHQQPHGPKTGAQPDPSFLLMGHWERPAEDTPGLPDARLCYQSRCPSNRDETGSRLFTGRNSRPPSARAPGVLGGHEELLKTLSEGPMKQAPSLSSLPVHNWAGTSASLGCSRPRQQAALAWGGCLLGGPQATSGLPGDIPQHSFHTHLKAPSCTLASSVPIGSLSTEV